MFSSFLCYKRLLLTYTILFLAFLLSIFLFLRSTTIHRTATLCRKYALYANVNQANVCSETNCTSKTSSTDSISDQSNFVSDRFASISDTSNFSSDTSVFVSDRFASISDTSDSICNLSETSVETLAFPSTSFSALSSLQKNMIYQVVSMECDTDYEGSLAVISCMLNRVDSPEYPDNLFDVIKQDSQFTAYYDPKTKTYPYLDRIPSDDCIRAVNDALQSNKRNLPENILYFRSSDYHTLNGYQTYKTIGDNTFFYIE